MNINELPEIINLKKQIIAKNREIQELEKEFLKKYLKLIVLMDAHSKEKSNIQDKFDYYGVSYKETVKERIEEVKDDQSGTVSQQQ